MGGADTQVEGWGMGGEEWGEGGLIVLIDDADFKIVHSRNRSDNYD